MIFTLSISVILSLSLLSVHIYADEDRKAFAITDTVSKDNIMPPDVPFPPKDGPFFTGETEIPEDNNKLTQLRQIAQIIKTLPGHSLPDCNLNRRGLTVVKGSVSATSYDACFTPTEVLEPVKFNKSRLDGSLTGFCYLGKMDSMNLYDRFEGAKWSYCQSGKVAFTVDDWPFRSVQQQVGDFKLADAAESCSQQWIYEVNGVQKVTVHPYLPFTDDSKPDIRNIPGAVDLLGAEGVFWCWTGKDSEGNLINKYVVDTTKDPTQNSYEWGFVKYTPPETIVIPIKPDPPA